MRKLSQYLCALCIGLGASLSAEVEYDIILLAPPGGELTSAVDEYSYYSSFAVNEAGYTGGAIYLDNHDKKVPFIYDSIKGFRIVDLPEDKTNASISSINNYGFAVGLYETGSSKNIFLYDIPNEALYDLKDAFSGLKVPSIKSNDEIFNLTLTDDKKVIFSHEKYNRYAENTTTTYIYDLTRKTASTFVSTPSTVNLKGQMIGSEELDFSDYGTAWFFDPTTGYQELGSLDIFNRWSVDAEAISSNGIVAGRGSNSHDERMAFTWSKEGGLQEQDLQTEYFSIHSVNDLGQFVGSREVECDDYHYCDNDMAFLFLPGYGLFELGIPGINSEARAINNKSQVVGSFDLRYQDIAFIWDFEHGARELNKLIPPDSGWKRLGNCFSITDSGYITGRGKYYGVEHYFLLVPRSQ